MQRPRIQLRTILVFIAFLALGMVVAVQSIRLDRSLISSSGPSFASENPAEVPPVAAAESRERRPRRQPCCAGQLRQDSRPLCQTTVNSQCGRQPGR